MQKMVTTAAFAAIAVSLWATSVMAQQQSTSPSIDRMSQAARGVVGGIYTAAGARACGADCGRAAGKVGVGVYDKSRDFSVRYGERLQEVGRKARDRIDSYRERRKGQ